MGSSPRAELPDCFARRLRAVLALRQESVEHFISRTKTARFSRGQLISVLAGRVRPDAALVSRLRQMLDGEAWAFVIGEAHTIDALAQERAGGVAA